jgi:hypothetical protein
MQKIRLDYFLLFTALLLLFLYFFIIFIDNIFINQYYVFSHQAFSFLNGHADLIINDLFPHPSNYTDALIFNNKYYWHEGPMPAILLLPFVLFFIPFNIAFHHGLLNFIFVFAIAFLLYRIFKLKKIPRDDAYFWLIAFLIGSPFLYTSIINCGPYFSQITAVLLITFSIYEYCNKKRPLVIGLAMGMVALTRLTAGLGIIFFILDILFIDKKTG